MINGNDFVKLIYEDRPLTISGAGAKRQVRGASGSTRVDTSPQVKLTSQDDGKGKSSAEVGKSYDRNNRPNDHRPNHINFQPPKLPENPTQHAFEKSPHLKQMWDKAGASMDMKRNTQRMQHMQRPGKEPKS